MLLSHFARKTCINCYFNYLKYFQCYRNILAKNEYWGFNNSFRLYSLRFCRDQWSETTLPVTLLAINWDHKSESLKLIEIGPVTYVQLYKGKKFTPWSQFWVPIELKLPGKLFQKTQTEWTFLPILTLVVKPFCPEILASIAILIISSTFNVIGIF